MTEHAVHWSEGLFISPHHFQVAARRMHDELALSEKWQAGYAYGLREVALDRDALANWRIGFHVLHARLRDGTALRFPEDALLSPVEIPKSAFRSSDDRLMVHLALPRVQLGRRNAEAGATAEKVCRYSVDAQEVEDENLPGNPLSLEVRWLNAHLIVGDDGLAGYETLPLLRLKLSPVAEAVPEVDRDYIPPLLACDAWDDLQTDVIKSVTDQFDGLSDRLAENMRRQKVAFESGHREDFQRILMLQAVNSALGYLVNLPYVRGVHPLTAYLELCRVVGLVSIFFPARRMIRVPRYDHDDLGKCFRAVRLALGEFPPEGDKYFVRRFLGAGLQMQVRLERPWLGTDWVFYMGVDSSLPFSEVEQILTKRLNLKVGGSEGVEVIYRTGSGGVSWRPEPSPPRIFPSAGWSYWKLDRKSPAWTAVETSLNLAIRFNENQIVGQINGEQTVQVNTLQGKLVDLSFALYAMPRPVSPDAAP